MVTLFSCVVRSDDGAAPNPFGEICTLVICKPSIRRKAEIGDWIIGTGSKNSPIGDMRGKVVYVMKVTEKLTMEEYDTYTKKFLPVKIPEMSSCESHSKFGDSIYDFSCRPPRMRQGVHREKNRQKDLGGLYALLSKHFWYFGHNVKGYKLPDNLQQIVQQGRGHRSRLNEPYIEQFLNWLHDLGLKPGSYGRPMELLRDSSNISCECS
jgi:hypothetical protein